MNNPYFIYPQALKKAEAKNAKQCKFLRYTLVLRNM